jgi:hypothetical protein
MTTQTRDTYTCEVSALSDNLSPACTDVLKVGGLNMGGPLGGTDADECERTLRDEVGVQVGGTADMAREYTQGSGGAGVSARLKCPPDAPISNPPKLQKSVRGFAERCAG